MRQWFQPQGRRIKNQRRKHMSEHTKRSLEMLTHTIQRLQDQAVTNKRIGETDPKLRMWYAAEVRAYNRVLQKIQELQELDERMFVNPNW
jgi:hypothetical protein